MSKGVALIMNASRRPPPPGVVAAAEQDYHAVRDDLAGLIAAVKVLLANGHSELEAVTDVWMTLRTQQDNPSVLLLSAAAIVRLATSPESKPVPPPGEQPQTETR